jgi:AraC-like DNA-binding protein
MRTPAEPTASVDLARMLLRHASRKGVDAGEICRAVGVEAGVLEQPGARVSAERFAALWDAIASRAGDAEFGLHFGAAIFGSASGHLVLAVLRNCPTVGDAIERFLRYHDLLTDFVQLAMRREAGTVSVGWTPPAGLRVNRHHVEAVLTAFVTTMRQLTEDRFVPDEVRFCHPAPEAPAEHERILGAPVRFGRRANEVVFARRLLALPIVLASGELLRDLELLADGQLARAGGSPTWARKTASAIREVLLGGSQPVIAAVSARLAVGARTLQAKLAREGTGYRELLDAARRELATSLLRRNDLALHDIVFLLGFAEQSAFNHAFKRWTGTTPNAFRKRHAAGGG